MVLKQPIQAVERKGKNGFTKTAWEVSKAFRACLDDRLRPMGHTKATLTVVGALACSCTPMTQRELAEAIQVEGPTLVRLLDRLEGMGWVQREQSPDDRRMKHVYLTDKAQPFLDELVRTARGLEAEVMDGISEEDVARAHEVLLTVRGRLRALSGKCCPGGS